MTVPSGYFFMDGIDLGLAFNMIIEDGTANFLLYPPKKASTEHDWGDSNGRDVDLSQVFFDQRTGTLNCAIFANSEDEFFQKHDQFIATLTKPGTRRFEFRAHNNRSYFVYYVGASGYKQVTALQGISDDYLIAHKFSIEVCEPEPQIDSSNVYLTTEDGSFLIA